MKKKIIKEKEYINIITNDGESRVISKKEHDNMVHKWGIDNLPYSFDYFI